MTVNMDLYQAYLFLPWFPWKMEVCRLFSKEGHGDSHEKKNMMGRGTGKSHGSDFFGIFHLKLDSVQIPKR